MTAARQQIQDLLDTARREGLPLANVRVPDDDARPWPVTLLTALGGWLVAIPLLGVVGLLLGDLARQSGGPYVIGALVLAGALTVLRAQGLSVFVEQLAVPFLLVGGGALGFGLYRDLPDQLAAALLALLALTLAWWLPRPWLRVLLGALAAAMAGSALTFGRAFFSGPQWSQQVGVALHLVLLIWLVAQWLQPRWWGHPRLGLTLEPVAAGWVLVLLAGLCTWSGMSFLVAGSLGGGLAGAVATDLAQQTTLARGGVLLQGVSVLAALGAMGVAGRAWPSLRSLALMAIGLVLVLLCAFMPALGAVLLVLALLGTSQRWLLASAAAAAAVWIVGSFYYQLRWSLTEKAMLLVGAAVLLGLLARLGWPARDGATQTGHADPTAAPAVGRRGLLVALTALASLVLINHAIWQKERLIANGQKVFVELAPVDPRSLMQGDFMRLAFRIPEASAGGLPFPLAAAQRPHLIGRLDPRGVLTPLRVATPGSVLATGELAIELSPKAGRWTLVSDAWFFREGDGARWQQARYGEFRVSANGQALLVGMADAQLRAIEVGR